MESMRPEDPRHELPAMAVEKGFQRCAIFSCEGRPRVPVAACIHIIASVESAGISSFPTKCWRVRDATVFFRTM